MDDDLYDGLSEPDVDLDGLDEMDQDDGIPHPDALYDDKNAAEGWDELGSGDPDADVK